MRLEIHCHTKYSQDSLLSLMFLYLKCRLCKIKYIAITDHNNIIGATKFKKYCEDRGNKIFVIVGEEIMTQDGEIIGLFIENGIPNGLSCKDTIELIRKQNGIVYVPHPYDKKRAKTVLKEEKIKEYSNLIDCIECYNGRNISDFYEQKQNEIAEKYNIVKIIGSDAHTFFEIGRNFVDVNISPNNAVNFKKAIVSAKFHKKKCLKFCHKITKISKLLKLLEGGQFNEILRIINNRNRKKM